VRRQGRCEAHGRVVLLRPSLTLGAGAVLWIDAGVTLNLTGSGTPGVISVTGANAGIYGEGTIDAAEPHQAPR